MIRQIRPSRAALALLLLAAAPAAAQPRVEYEIRFPNRVHHEAEVTATFHGVPAGRPLEVRMSRTSPGRYALHEFAKNVYAVRATDGAGRPLAVTRPDPHQWDVAGHDGTVRVHYTLFGDRADGTYTGIDATHAHLNIPATFAWARGMEQAPVRVRFERPEGWTVATQLVPTADSSVFTAPDLAYFMDSPTEIGPLDWRTWTIPAADGATDTLRLAVHHQGTAAELDDFARKADRIVAEQVAIWGTPPPFDHGTYSFLADYLPWVDGDGMEHRNSTVLTRAGSIAEDGTSLLNTLSHEFFHAWNVERVRPASLEPFDLAEANMSGELWFAEGFTSYYDDLVLRRAGILDDAQYAAGVGGTVNSVVNAPGRRYFSAREMSMQAPFVDAAVSIDHVNRVNTYLSYYTWGAGIGLALDLSIRARSDLTLDDYMRAVWREFGAQTDAPAPARTYTVDDLRRVLGEVTGDPAFADDFFARYVEGREAADYEGLLARAGFLLRKANPGRPWLGVPLQAADGGSIVLGYPPHNGSAYPAGITRGDVVVSIGGMPTPTPDDVGRALAAHAPGDTVAIELVSRGGTRTVTVALVENPALEVVPYEAAGREPTPEMLAFRAAWLGSRAER